MNGLGIDRHLFGLKLAAIELGMEIPKLYSDVGFTRSSHMRVSTSQVKICDFYFYILTYRAAIVDHILMTRFSANWHSLYSIIKCFHASYILYCL